MHDELRSILRTVRTRWRLRVALRGLMIVVAAAAISLTVASFVMERAGFSPGSVTAARIAAYLLIAAAALIWLVLPLVRQVPDARIALYLEEHEPTLDAAVVSAVEQAGASRAPVSEGLSRGVLASAVRRLHEVDDGRQIERPALRAGGIILAIAIASIAIVLGFGPQYLRHGARALFAPWRSAEAAAPYAIRVAPGDTTVPRGGDLEVRVRLSGFSAEEVTLVATRGQAEPERIAMPRGADSSDFALRLFDLDQQTEYFVETGPVRSPVYRIAVVDLPYVRRIDLEYRFPIYTGLAPQRVDDAGDIAAVRGTRVTVGVVSTIPVTGGRILVDGKDTVALVPADSGRLTGTLVVTRSGFYKVELLDAGGRYVPASLDYAIDALEDGAPTVSITRPGRDTKVSSLEEVFIEARAEDDYGVQRLDLFYSVNGGPQQTVPLHRGGRLKDVAAGHTLYMEEMQLEPGDVISYFARAADADRAGAKMATTDIYFLEIRPFNREYRQAEQQGAAGGGGGDASPSALSQRQREIVAATFKVIRDRAITSEKETRENVSTILLSEGRLREQVETLAGRMQERGMLGKDSTFDKIANELPKAAAAMREAEERLARQNADSALPYEQRALQHLQRAEAAYREVSVSFGGQPGGGGGGEQPNAEDLADLFELENDKLRNQYEQVERGERQQEDQRVDETLERLRRLAERQQQEAERMRARAEQMSRSGGGGSSQRQLAQETEELARQLERLAREHSSQELAETARRLQEAASAMRRSASGQREQGAADAAAAQRRLEEARRRLDESRSSRIERDARELAARAERLTQEQREVARDVEEMVGSGAQRDLARTERLSQRKDAMANEVSDIEGRLDRMSSEARRDQRDASRKLQEAANAIRDSRLQDRIRFSKGVMRSGSPEYTRGMEEQITTALDDVRQRIDDAAGSVREPNERRVERSLDRARDIARGLESLEERTRQAREQGSGQQSQSERSQSGQPQSGQPQSGRQQSGQPSQQQGQAGQPTEGGRAPGIVGAPQGGGTQGTQLGGGRLSPEQIRQLTREYRQRRADAEALRRDLAREGLNVRDLDRLIAQLRALESQRSYDAREELARLQASVLEGFKSFEFALRRAIEGDPADKPLIGGSPEVPAQYQKLVEEYYKALARKPPR